MKKELTLDDLLLDKIRVVFSKIRDKVKKGLDDGKKHIEPFFKDKDVSFITFTGAGDGVQVINGIPTPASIGRKAIIAVKVHKIAPITEENFAREIAFVEIFKNPLECLSCIAQEGFFPILSNQDNQAGWSELVSKDLMEKLNGFLSQLYVVIGQVNGKTQLPLPVQDETLKSMNNKERAHILETAIITWQKQIKSVLSQDPESLLKQGQDPNPLKELEFWRNRADNLNHIIKQINSDRVLKYLKELERAKSAYSKNFNELKKEVSKAAKEANSNFTYLQTLAGLFEELVGDNLDFPKLPEIFQPIMHMIHLIWEHSTHYNTTPRLVVLIREICNAIITKSKKFVDGGMIFAMVTSGDNEEAHNKLMVTYEVCTKFKAAYYEYKSKAKNPWTVTTNAVFYRLDNFMDRCQDLMQFASTIIQFTKLSKIELGGTKGNALSISLNQIYEEFKNVVEDFKKVTFDILDTNAKEFDEEFLKFRTRIKELERRIGAILNQSFEDLDTIISKLKLLESFEGLLSRQIIHDELEKKYIVLLDMFKTDLVKVQALFLTGKKLIEDNDPQSPLPVGMPPVSGALNWSRGLEERIREPMEKLSSVSQSIQEREEYKDVHKLYTSIMKGLKEFEAMKIKAWEGTVDDNSQAKLLLAVLKKNTDGRTISVNFDQALTELLREVKYLLLLDKDVPEKAKQVFAKADTYRQQTCQLDAIVDTYNEILTTLNPVQYPLFEERIKRMDEQLSEGFEKYQWVTDKLNDFIGLSKHEVTEVNKLVMQMKSAELKIKQAMGKWNKPMMEKKNKPQTPYEVYEPFKANFDSDLRVRMKETAKDVSATTSGLGDALKVQKTSNEWQDYESYINCMVVQEIVDSVKKSLEFLKVVTSQQKGEPIFEIDLLLEDEEKCLVFNPPLIETKVKKDQKPDPRDKSVRDVVFALNSDFMQLAAYFTRLDGKKTGDFLKEITDDFEVAEFVTCISNNIFNIESAVNSYSKEFAEYQFLWVENLEETFLKFLQSSNDKKEQTEEDEEEAEERKKILDRTIFKDVTASPPPLALFDAEIARLNAVEGKISEIKEFIDIHWIRVRSEKLRESLTSEIKKWIDKYSSYLKHDLTQKLSNLQQFTKDVEEGIKLIPKGTDTPEEKAQLDRVMNLLRDMKEVYDVANKQNAKGQTMIDLLRESVQTLKKHGITIDEQVIDQIENAKSALKDINSKSSEARELINPLQTKETENIKAEAKDFGKAVEEFLGEFKSKLPYDTSSATPDTVDHSYGLIESYFDRIGKFEDDAKKLNAKEALFGLQRTDFKKLKEYKNELKLLKYMWDMIAYVEGLFQDWKVMPWKEIKSTEDMMQELRTIKDKVMSANNTKNKSIKKWGAFRNLEERIKQMHIVLEQVDKLHNDCIKERHWQELMQKIKQEININNPNFCLEDLIRLKLFNFQDDVAELHALATKEAQMEKQLAQMEAYWDKAELKMEVKKGGEVPLLYKLDDIITRIEDDAQKLSTMLSQRKYVKYFEARVQKLQDSNKMMNSVIEKWIKVQRKWENLEPIFTKDDIRGPLPDATKKFENNSETFKKIMKETQESPKVIQACLVPGREELLDEMSNEMEDCNKSLKEYIESKRKIFPRFYFLSPEQITDILAHATDPTSVTRHISSCFEGIKTLIFVKPTDAEAGVPKSCSAMESRHDPEVVKFHELFDCTGAVEVWLKRLEEHMQKTMKSIIKVAKPKADTWDSSPETRREEWIREFPSQIALLGSQMMWTEEVRNAIRNYSESGSESAMKECLEVVRKRIVNLIDKVRELALTREYRSKIMIVITNDVHGRDIIEKLIVGKINDEASFAWQSQIKFDWKDPECKINIAGWETTYSGEYVGNIIRLVITPLTDRCYITLTQALKLDMGAAPAGPAGTGKTETVKDLGRALGLMVQVYNCSEEMTKDSMEMVFLGLIQSGCWGCFDEFNRIAVEVLSVIATQVDTMQKALKDCRIDPTKTKFDFTPGKSINLCPTVGIFITMNPGYAGRTELPDNLKALFRSCAMVVPDFALICENMLMSEGFKEANSLSRKFTQLYDLNKDLLSKQMHYDWGMRAIKAVLRMSGKLKREEPNLDEDSLLMRALRDFNKPKIVTSDWPIISRVIEDLFPNCKADPKKDPNLESAIRKVSKKNKLQDEEGFVVKCIQLAEILEVRHCCFIIGPAGSGKTEVWRTLSFAMTEIGQEIMYEIVNPKAFTSKELYGSYTKAGDWKDGVISSVMRRMSKNMEPYNRESIANKWMVLDGDVDPDWIESMNSVMDDSKILTLVSQDRIELTSKMHMLLEVGHLKTATPATVSRGGVLFVNETDIGFKPYWDTWLEEFTKESGSDTARGVFYFAYNKLLSESNWEEIKSYSPVVAMVPLSCVQTLCKLLREFYFDYKVKKEKEKKVADYFASIKGTPKEDEVKVVLEAFFVYAMMWAVGGSLTEDRRAFSQLIKRLSNVRFPETGSCFDYFYDPEANEWVHWNTVVPKFTEPADDELFQNIRVPTLDTTRQGFMLTSLMNQERAVLFVGPSGTAKTTQVKQHLSALSKEAYKHCVLNFNSYTDPANVQKVMHDQLSKRFGRHYAPPMNTHMIYFIDDINMPKLDKYGYQAPIALLRQLIDHKQWFDRANVEDKFMYEGLLFIACMNQKAGSFNIDTRLQRHFAAMACSIPEKDVLEYITKKMTESFLAKFDVTVQNACSKLAKQSVELFTSIYNDGRFKPSAVKFHYTFNLRDLMKLIQAVTILRPQQYKGAPAQFVKFWAHENLRNYQDRMSDPKDIEEIRSRIYGYARGFEADMNEVSAMPNIFTSFISSLSGQDKSYMPIKDVPTLKQVISEVMDRYNTSGNESMNLVLFDQALEHICRIARIIDQPTGHALLIGVGGSGKQSLSRVAAYIEDYMPFTISLTSGYDTADLKRDLQTLYRMATIKPGKPQMLLFTDAQISKEEFLVYINDILANGFVLDLFTKQEMDQVIGALRNEAKSYGFSDNEVPAYFLSKAQKNIHIVLCFSPKGPKFKQRAREFPGVISCTSMDWFQDWPKEALIDVGKSFLQKIELQPEIRDAIAAHIAEVHSSVEVENERFKREERRINYTTPKIFLGLIDLYQSLLSKKQEEAQKRINNLERGLTTMELTKTQVEKLQKELVVAKVKVAEEQKKTDVLVDDVSKKNAVAEEESKLARADEKVANEKRKEAESLKKEADEQLSKALPILESAKAAAKNLKPKSIGEMKAFPQPPDGVKMAGNCMYLLLKKKPAKDWNEIKNSLNMPKQIMQQTQEYDGTTIEEHLIEKTKSAFNNDETSFLNSARTGCEAAGDIAVWVVNMIRFNKAYKDIKPMMDKQTEAQNTFQQAMSAVESSQKRVATAVEQVTKLSAELDKCMASKKLLEDNANALESKQTLALRLINGLADENTRWGKNVQELKERIVMLIGDTLIAASFISYIGAFSYNFRQHLWKDVWLEDMRNRGIPMSPTIDPLYMIVSEGDIAKWKNQKLPADQVSFENAAILTSCTRWPLIIDPQKQGIEWLINKAEDEKYDMPKIQVPGTRGWSKEVIRCIRDGLTLLIENAGEDFEPTLEPVLAKKYIQIGKRFVMRFDEEDSLDVHPNFQLYIQTKLSNPHYRPEITAQCTIINFIVTEKGLEDQMLATVVNLEDNELEAKREAIVKAQNENKWTLQKLEKDLLENLSQADSATILDNKDLIEGLEKTKATATDIAKQQEASKKLEEEINKKRELYRRVAAEGSTLFFLLMQLAFVNRMYQYSLDSFDKFFRYAINHTKHTDDIDKRVVALREKIRYKIYQWVRRGLFEKHRQIFLTQITLRLMQKGVLTIPYVTKEVDFLLKAQPKTDGPKHPDWMQEKHWQLCTALTQIEGFENFTNDVEKSGIKFKEWYNDLTPESTPLPSDWKRASLFHMLLILRCMRRDRITMGLNRLTSKALEPSGAKFIAAETSFTEIMNKSYKMSSPHTPFFFILSPGSAPKKMVENLVKEQHPKDFKSLSMGQGVDKDAEEYLARGHKEGIWVFLENCHLMPNWLPRLEKMLDDYALEGGHEAFRLFLSGEPSDRIPIGLLERCIKLTCEPPQELKANVQMAFKNFTPKEFEEKSEKYRCVLFALCFFHGLVVVRKRFGSTGWNGNYPFNLQDLRDSAKVMETYLEGNKVPWDDMKYIIGEIMYGGHITDDWDRKLCKAYLDFLMKEELFDEMDMIPYPPKNSNTSFKCPKVPNHEAYFAHINSLPETPLTFGMNPNAELNYREDQADTLFTTLQDLQPKDAKGASEDASAQSEKFKDVKDIVEKFESQKISPDLLKGDENRSPFQNVFMQEAERMNGLISLILSSMNDLELAMSGQLTMTEAMDRLQDCLIMYRVPEAWQKYESARALLPWLTNLGYRIEQLNSWKDNSSVAPKILYINYLFNPQAFLTAIKQTEAQRSRIELNKLYIQTEITGKLPENVEASIDLSLKKAAIGVNVYGFFLEGCRIDLNSKFLDESEPKKLFQPLPVVICRAAAVPAEGKEDKNYFICPVYKTKRRGPITFVFTAQLKTKDPPQKWTLAGAAIILDVEDDLSKPFFGKQ